MRSGVKYIRRGREMEILGDRFRDQEAEKIEIIDHKTPYKEPSGYKSWKFSSKEKVSSSRSIQKNVK